MSLADILDHSPPGAWRAALDRSATCAACRQSVCGHSDLEYAGIMPAQASPAVALNAAAPAGALPPCAPAGTFDSPPAPLLEAASVPPVHGAPPLSPTPPVHEARCG